MRTRTRRPSTHLTSSLSIMKPKELAALILLAAVWGGSFLFIRVAVPSLGPFALVLGRLVLAALVLAAVAIVIRRPVDIRRHARQLLVLGALNAAIPFTLISSAELHLTASLAAILNATTPLFAAAFSVTWLGERWTTARGLGLLAGVAGVTIMVGWSPVPLTAATLLAVGAMLVASAGYAASGIYTRRRLAGVSTYSLALGQQLGALVWLLLPAAIWRPAGPIPTSALWAVVALAVVCTAGAYLLYFYLIETVGPTRTTTVTYIVPAFGVLWGAIFLDEPITVGMVIGFAFVLVSVVLVNGVRFRRARPVASSQ